MLRLPLLALLMLGAGSSQALAMSEGCSMINEDWQNVSGNENGDQDGNIVKSYRPLVHEEVIAWVQVGTPNDIIIDMDGVISTYKSKSGNYAIENDDAHVVLSYLSAENPNTTITILCTSDEISLPSTLDNGQVGVAYNDSVAPDSGSYTYSILDGSLPDGLSLHTTTGAISGTPSAAGSFSFLIKAQNNNSSSYGAQSYTVTIVPMLTLSPASGAEVEAILKTSYDLLQSFSVSGGTEPYTFVMTGTPPGLSLSSDGKLSGTPTAAGSFDVTVTATDGASLTTSADYTVKVSPLASDGSATVDANSSDNVITPTVDVGDASGAWSLTVSSGPSHGSVSMDGTSFVYTPNPGYVGRDTIAYVAEFDEASSARATISITVSAPTVTLSSLNGTSIAATVGSAFSNTFAASGGTSPYSYELVNSNLPATLALAASSGLLSGTPTEVGSYSFGVKATDSSTGAGPFSVTQSYTLAVSRPTISFDPAPGALAPGETGEDYSQTITASGGSEPYTYAVTAGALPDGLSLSTDGEITGIPTTTGSSSFTVTATDAYGSTGAAAYTLAVSVGPEIEKIDSLVHDFVENRLDRIAANVGVPDLMSRRSGGSGGPLTSSASAYTGDVRTSLSTSLAQIAAATTPEAEASAFNLWLDGTFALFSDDGADDSFDAAHWGSFVMAEAGADYLLSEQALLGLAVFIDRTTQPGDEGESITGTGWLAGPYASFELGQGVFWNTSLFYGGSANAIDFPNWYGSFDTTRWLADTSLSGSWALDAVTTLSPKLRVVYITETVADYAVDNGSASIDMDGFSEEELRVSLGTTLSRLFVLQDGSTLTPSLGLTGGFAGLGGEGLFGSATLGLALATPSAWMIDGSVSAAIEGDGSIAASAKAGASKRF